MESISASISFLFRMIMLQIIPVVEFTATDFSIPTGRTGSQHVVNL